MRRGEVARKFDQLYCGVNPHASENGQFGDEEERIVTAFDAVVTTPQEAAAEVNRRMNALQSAGS